MFEVIHQVQDLYKIIKLKEFKKTPGVSFDIITSALLPKIDCIEKVVHQPYAFSPGMLKSMEQQWFMHPYQDDHLLLLHGSKEVELYNSKNKTKATFLLTPNQIYKNQELLYEGDFLLMWPKGVFHRTNSKDKGSASINIAVRYDEFNDHNNFNMYELNTVNGSYKVIG